MNQTHTHTQAQTPTELAADEKSVQELVKDREGRANITVLVALLNRAGPSHTPNCSGMFAAIKLDGVTVVVAAGRAQQRGPVLVAKDNDVVGRKSIAEGRPGETSGRFFRFPGPENNHRDSRAARLFVRRDTS